MFMFGFPLSSPSAGGWEDGEAVMFMSMSGSASMAGSVPRVDGSRAFWSCVVCWVVGWESEGMVEEEAGLSRSGSVLTVEGGRFSWDDMLGDGLWS